MVVFCMAANAYHRSAPNIFWEPEKDGTDSPAWNKLYYLGSYAISNFSNYSDVILFWASVVLLLVLLLAPAFSAPPEGSSPRREFVGLAIGWFFLYLVVPRVLMSTWYIFERLPLWWLAFAVAAAPHPGPRLAAQIRPALVALGVVAGINTVVHFARIPDARDASAIIDDIPPGARVVAVMHASDAAPSIWRRIWVHLAAYHQVRHSGELAFSFTRYASLPVRPRPTHTPPWYAGGLEWNPQLYDPVAPYASYFTTVLVRTPDQAPAADPRALTFGAYADQVKLLSHRGRFYLYDASGIAQREP
jgi:hypothetical protein